MSLTQKRFYPQKIFVEKAALGSYLVKKFRENFPLANILEIESIKSYIKGHNQPSIANYNKRQETIFILNENYDFLKRCPCTKGALECNYQILNLSFGCIYECTYCYLQEYTNSPGIIFCVNLDKFFEHFTSYKKPGMRLGTGEFTDSLMLDNITEYSLSLINFFNQHRDVLFEFKTKSNNVENLLKARHRGNIVVSWSVNPQKVIKENEFFSTSLKQRLQVAFKCANAGYRVGFHFDPIIYFKGFEKEYSNTIELLFSKIKPKSIAWISLGTLRFNPGLKPIIEARFPENKILDAEMVLGFDNKLRYLYRIRYNIYKFILEKLKRHTKNVPLYLCMEGPKMWQALNLERPKFYGQN